MAATVAIGCGGGSSEEAGAVSNARQFVAQADAICSKGQEKAKADFEAFLKQKKISEIGEPGQSSAEVKQLLAEAAEAVAIPGLQRQVNELRALEAPDDKKAEADAYLSTIEGELETAKGEPAALFTAAQKIFAKSDSLAKALGFKVCGGH